MTTLYRFLPQPVLSPSIEAFYYAEGHEGHQEQLERSLPDGRMALIINLAHDTIRVGSRDRPGLLHSLSGSVLSGASARFTVIDMSVLVTTISVQFRPGGAETALCL